MAEQQPEATADRVWIAFERSGGPPGPDLHASVDSADLAPEDAARLRELVSALAALPTPPAPGETASGFCYRVTVGTPADQRVLAWDEASVPDAIRPTLEWLTVLARPAAAQPMRMAFAFRPGLPAAPPRPPAPPPRPTWKPPAPAMPAPPYVPRPGPVLPQPPPWQPGIPAGRPVAPAPAVHGGPTPTPGGPTRPISPVNVFPDGGNPYNVPRQDPTADIKLLDESGQPLPTGIDPSGRRVRWVYRGSRVTLDASGSSSPNGPVVSWQWTFTPANPADSVGTTAAKQGVQVSVQLLGETQVTLTVTDSAGRQCNTDASVYVASRPAKTDYAEPVRGLLPQDSKEVPTADPPFLAGATRCAYHTYPADAALTDNHVFCPPPNPSADCHQVAAWDWENVAFWLQQVNDPGGPYDQAYYVGDVKLQIRRVMLINPYIQPNGPPVPGVPKEENNWYARNKRADALAAHVNVEDYLAKVQAHEQKHADLIRGLFLALKGDDPATLVESLVNRDRDALKKKVNEKITAAEVTLRMGSDDGLPQLAPQYHGNLMVWDGRQYLSRLCPETTGRPDDDCWKTQ